MGNQKDTQNTHINSYGHSDFYDNKNLINKDNYEFISKKTEKLVTALYMVSDCMENDDALKNKLRLLGVDLLSLVYKISNLLPVEKRDQFDILISKINEIISFIEISSTIGFISEMNTNILKKEFGILFGEVKKMQAKDKHFTFTLDQKDFDIVIPLENKGLSFIKDKRTNINNMSFIKSNGIKNEQISLPTFDRSLLKEDRTTKIISIIKDNKNGDSEGVSIKDIVSYFNDCSEKTIQRELNSLVTKNQIKKIGEKRWSRYLVINND